MDRLTGQVQKYAWGSPTVLPDLLGVEPSGEPQAELWLGAHPSASARLGDRPLDELVSGDPAAYAGRAAVAEFGARLPFLLKVLAAAEPLSLQAHPSREQAEAGFAREEAAGVAFDAGERTYRDGWPKPEAICALEDFDLLCGFRAPAETHALFRRLGSARALDLVSPLADGGAESVRKVFRRLLELRGDARDLVTDVVAAGAKHAGDEEPLGNLAQLVTELGDRHPNDPGVVAALLMNRVRLRRFEALFLPAGNLHAYLQGTGIEVQANSNNVVRGGLTSKHVDVAGLLEVVDFTPSAPTLVEVVEGPDGVFAYRTPAPEFSLWRLQPPGADPVLVPGHGSGRVVLVTDGSLTLTTDSELRLDRGQAAFLLATERVRAGGDGNAFVAASGLR